MSDVPALPGSGSLLRFPNRPRVIVPGEGEARTVYETVATESLRGLLDDLARFVYAQARLPLEERHRWFARLAAAAAVNAVLDT